MDEQVGVRKPNIDLVKQLFTIVNFVSFVVMAAMPDQDGEVDQDLDPTYAILSLAAVLVRFAEVKAFAQYRLAFNIEIPTNLRKPNCKSKILRRTFLRPSPWKPFLLAR